MPDLSAADAVEVGDQVWVRVGEIASRGQPTTARRSAAVRAVLRDLLRLVAPAVVDAPLVHTPAGAPRLLGGAGIGVSLSHDGPLAVAAVAVGRAVGVDVQLPVRGCAARLGRRCLGAAADLLAGLPETTADEETAWVWSVQEACAKATGRGLDSRPWTLPVPPLTPSGRLPGLRWRQLRAHAAAPLSCAWSG